MPNGHQEENNSNRYVPEKEISLYIYVSTSVSKQHQLLKYLFRLHLRNFNWSALNSPHSKKVKEESTSYNTA